METDLTSVVSLFSACAKAASRQDKYFFRDRVDLAHALVVVHDRNRSLANSEGNGTGLKKEW